MPERRLSILIVEDSTDDLYLLQQSLHGGGYGPPSECTPTLDAVSAALERQPWDLVISDFALPGFTGRDVVELVRSRAAATPVIILTGTPEHAAARVSPGTPVVAKGDWKRLTAAIEAAVAPA